MREVDFQKFIADNREAIYARIAANTKYNEQGHAVISRDDEWCDETEWDELYLELKYAQDHQTE